MRFKFSLFITLIVIALSGCGPNEETIQATQSAQITQIAEEVLATQAALITPTSPPPTIGAGSIKYTEQDGMFMVYVPAGEYKLGAEPEDIQWAFTECQKINNDCNVDSFENETPAYTVFLDTFWIDQTEVTNDQFSRFVEEIGYKTTAEILRYSRVYDDDDFERTRSADWQHPTGAESSIENLGNHPVTHVAWHDAWNYCAWAGKRLPTEAEWEAAARGKDSLRFPWGNTPPTGELANLADENLPRSSWANMDANDYWRLTAPVGHYPAGASPFGVYDMAGNVNEWVYDGYAPNHENISGANPVYVEDISKRAIRSSYFGSMMITARNFRRFGAPTDYSASHIGFRCVESHISLPDPPPMPTEIVQSDIALLGRVYPRTSPIDGDELGRLSSDELDSLEILGQYDNCSWIKFSSETYSEAWIGGSVQRPDFIVYPTCEDLEEIYIRPENGANYFENFWVAAGGEGVLRVKNPGNTDIFIALQNVENPEDKPLGFYIHSNATAELNEIADGTYDLYYTTGTIWVNYENRFKDAQTYAKFDDSLVFETIGTQYTIWELTMQETADGNTSTSVIDPSAFPIP